MPYLVLFTVLILLGLFLQVLFALRATMDKRPIPKLRIVYNVVYIVSLAALSSSTLSG